MWKSLALVACCAMAVTPFALADEGNPTAAPEPNCTQTLSQAKAVVKEHTARSRWRHRHPLARSGICHRSADLERFAHKRKHGFFMYRVYRKLTPYRCQRGPYGTWAKPCYVLSCESGFSWGAYNPSGAVGPYQLLGWGAPFPVRSFQDKLAHHRIAASLSLSNWVCA